MFRTGICYVRGLMINEEIVRENLKKVIEQKSGKDVIALGIISSIIIKGGDIGFALEAAGNTQANEELRRNCEQAVKAIPGVTKVIVVATCQKKLGNKKLNYISKE